jgi:hypothetical protein
MCGPFEVSRALLIAPFGRPRDFAPLMRLTAAARAGAGLTLGSLFMFAFRLSLGVEPRQVVLGEAEAADGRV